MTDTPSPNLAKFMESICAVIDEFDTGRYLVRAYIHKTGLRLQMHKNRAMAVNHVIAWDELSHARFPEKHVRAHLNQMKAQLD